MPAETLEAPTQIIHQEQQHIVPPVPELVQETNVIVFRDERGIERRPNSVAAECYASPEIQQAVSEHFLLVDRELESIEAMVAKLSEAEAAGEQPRPFNPLTSDLLEQVLATATSQLPGLMRPVTKTVEQKTTTGKFIKREQIISVEVTEDEAVTGYTTGLEDRDTRRRWGEAVGGIVRGGFNITPEDLPTTEQRIQEQLVRLLTGTEPTPSEQVTHTAHEAKLPLLATKLRDSGLTAEQAKSLSWDDIVQLVPELTTAFGDIQTGVQYQSAKALYEGLTALEAQLSKIAPIGCETIARLYYSDELLSKMANLQKLIVQLQQAPYKTIHPGAEDLELPDFTADQHKSIARFFEYRDVADTILIHGTPYAPRVLKSGVLKPTHKMSVNEFTFNSNRGPNGMSGIDGSRGVHWAAALGGMNYGPDASQISVYNGLKRQLTDRGGVEFAEEELNKGGVGMGRFTIRLGDLVAITPYGGNRLTSHQGLRDAEETPKIRFGVVELTPKGWQQITGQVRQGQGKDDVAFVAAPEHRDLDELFDYEYPIEAMMIGTPSQDPETIRETLREQGWSEEEIDRQCYEFTNSSGSQEALQAQALANPKYKHSVVVPIRLDV